MDTMRINLKLFMGMGVIWYLEILAFVLTFFKLDNDIFVLITDILNMSQVKKRSYFQAQIECQS